MFAEIVEVAAAAAGMYEQRKNIGTMFSRFRRLIVNGTTRVVVFGAGGTGKTTLGRYLSGVLDTDSAVDPYEETMSRVDFSFGGKIPGIVLVPPGQSRRRANTWDELFQILSQGKAVGVINVVCNGFHSTELELSRLRVFQKDLPFEAIRERYVEQMLSEELDALSETIPHLKAAKGDLWMITLVTKQDLWWTDRYKVRDYYQNGEYGKLVDDVMRHRGEAHFKHDFFSAALVSQNLTTRDGQELASTVAGYDDPLRLTNLGRFAKALADLAND
jgi:energy-coupling factor transporter ATP-binding protein EcfA2